MSELPQLQGEYTLLPIPKDTEPTGDNGSAPPRTRTTRSRAAAAAAANAAAASDKGPGGTDVEAKERGDGSNSNGPHVYSISLSSRVLDAIRAQHAQHHDNTTGASQGRAGDTLLRGAKLVLAADTRVPVAFVLDGQRYDIKSLPAKGSRACTDVYRPQPDTTTSPTASREERQRQFNLLGTVKGHLAVTSVLGEKERLKMKRLTVQAEQQSKRRRTQLVPAAAAAATTTTAVAAVAGAAANVMGRGSPGVAVGMTADDGVATAQPHPGGDKGSVVGLGSSGGGGGRVGKQGDKASGSSNRTTALPTTAHANSSSHLTPLLGAVGHVPRSSLYTAPVTVHDHIKFAQVFAANRATTVSVYEALQAYEQQHGIKARTVESGEEHAVFRELQAEYLRATQALRVIKEGIGGGSSGSTAKKKKKKKKKR